MNCNNCGAEIKDNQKFCPKCGRKIDVSNDSNLLVTKIEPNLNKKKIIIAVIVVILVILITIFVVISNSPKYEGTIYDLDKNKTTQTITETTQSTTITTTKEHKLSDDCTYVLADGYDGDDYYELVANQIDSYPQSTIKMGVIKNNEWLVELSSDFPFLNDNWFNDKGAAYRDDDDPHNTYESGSYHFEYVGEGTFYYYYQEEYVAFQSNQTIYKPDTGYYFNLFNFFVDEREDFLNNGEFLANDEEKGFCYYNLNSGEMRAMNGIFSDNNEPDRNCLYGIHDGVFYARKDKSWSGDGYNGFFDLNGNMIIDLSKYNITDYHGYIFKNGEYTITCKNNSNVKYDITFDSTGKITGETKIS